MNRDNEEVQNWKDKYFNALGELEAKEKVWVESEQILRTGLSRLTLAADSSNDVLNRQLERLRTLLRGGSNNSELRDLLDSISNSIRQLDEQRKIVQHIPRPGEVLEEALGKIEFPRGMGHRAKAVQKKLLRATDGDHEPLIKEFVDLIIEALQWVEGDNEAVSPPTLPESSPEKGRLLGKLFSREEKGQKAEVVEGDNLNVARNLLQEMVEGLITPADHRELMLQRIERGSQESQLYALGRELINTLKPVLNDAPVQIPKENLSSHEILLRLLERIDVPALLAEKVVAIKELLAAADEAHTEQAIRALADLIGEMRHQVQDEKSEIESFLKQMSERLQEIDITFQQNVLTQRESFEGGRELDSAVSEQVQGIEETVTLAQDILSLKEALHQKVDAIRSHMQEFREAEQQRIEVAEKQVEQLTSRLQNAQQESDKLRQRIKKERDLAMIDPLTGIPNRFAYNERLAQEVARWKRYHNPLVLSVWDVDNFKRINDSYGHQAGDKVLTVIARQLQEKVRETDFAARFGGEEFVLLLPETDLEKASVVAEHIRKSVEACEFHYRGNPVPITISCGLSQFREGDTAEQVFARADAALYKAKENGRNQCRSA
jgi:diguanylate cyclase